MNEVSRQSKDYGKGSASRPLGLFKPKNKVERGGALAWAFRALCATLPVPLSTTVDVAKAFRKFGRAHGNNQLGQRRNANEET